MYFDFAIVCVDLLVVAYFLCLNSWYGGSPTGGGAAQLLRVPTRPRSVALFRASFLIFPNRFRASSAK